MPDFTVTLGKDVTITGVSHARSCTVSSSASEIDVTAFGDANRKFRRGMIEQTVDVECVDAPGVSVGGTFVLGGTETGAATYIVTSVARNEPLDDIVTYTVSGKRSAAAS